VKKNSNKIKKSGTIFKPIPDLFITKLTLNII